MTAAQIGPFKLFRARTLALAFLLCAPLLIAAHSAQAQTETVLYNFTRAPDGSLPDSSLTFDHLGNLYGTTIQGGAYGWGTVFELSPNGSGGWNESVLYSFTGGTDGRNPYHSNVIFDAVGNLYGTTLDGGAYDSGVVFELSPSGSNWTETVLYNFGNNANPVSGLITDATGNLYGASAVGVFELSPSNGSWTEKVISSFGTGFGLTMDAAGHIFGVTAENGWQVWELSANGNGGRTFTLIFSHLPEDGVGPCSSLAVDRAGNLYGSAQNRTGLRGMVYKISYGKKGWKMKNISTFKPNEGVPGSAVILDSAGNIYGTTPNGILGTVYELAAGTYTRKVLWSFDGTDGYETSTGLILDGNGNLYGTSIYGGSSYDLSEGNLGYGVVYEVTP